MYLEKNIRIAKGYHRRFTIKTVLSLSNKFKPFSFRKKLNSNKLLNKQFNLRSKAPIKYKNLFVKICYRNSILLLKLALQLIINHINKKIITLFCCSNGIFFYFISTSKDRLFKFSKLVQKNLFRKFVLKKHMSFVFKIKRLRKISLIPCNKTLRVSICRAVGCYAKIMRINRNAKLALVKLPSKKTYLIPFLTIVARGFIRKLYKKKLVDTHAGFYRLLGKKSNSRGVAMNPIDHPHGGNSNSIKLHRTPWGLPTKKK